MYTHLAHLYDWPGTLDLAEETLTEARSVLSGLGIRPPGRLVDLACGTGGITLGFAQDGWQVSGLDASEAMLAQAQAKAQAQGTAAVAFPVSWRQGDMTSFVLDEPAQVITCFCDSLNHLLSADAVACLFQAVHQALAPGGVFLFDTNTEAAFLELWQGEETSEGPNYRLTVKTAYDAQTGQARALFTVQEHTEAGLCQREDVVNERFYAPDSLQTLLQAAGFGAIRHHDFTPFDILEADTPLKTFWVCHR